MICVCVFVRVFSVFGWFVFMCWAAADHNSLYHNCPHKAMCACSAPNYILLQARRALHRAPPQGGPGRCGRPNLGRISMVFDRNTFCVGLSASRSSSWESSSSSSSSSSCASPSESASTAPGVSRGSGGQGGFLLVGAVSRHLP